MQPNNNPFQAPAASLERPTHEGVDLSFIPGGRKCGAASGVAWLKNGWKLFRQNIGVWLGVFVVFSLFNAIIGGIPWIGALLTTLATPVLLSGLFRGCLAQHMGSGMTFSHLFSGFESRFGPLVLLGLIELLLLLVFGVVVALTTVVLPVLSMLLIPAFVVPYAMALWFAPALITFQNCSPGEALKYSFLGCLKNWLPFLVYGLVVFVPILLMLLPLFMVIDPIQSMVNRGDVAPLIMLGLGALLLLLGVGFLFFGITINSIYSSYRDIFLDESKNQA